MNVQTIFQLCQNAKHKQSLLESLPHYPWYSSLLLGLCVPAATSLGAGSNPIGCCHGDCIDGKLPWWYGVYWPNCSPLLGWRCGVGGGGG